MLRRHGMVVVAAMVLAAPAAAQEVFHAGVVSSGFTVDPNLDPPLPTGSQFRKKCALALTQGLCVDLYTAREPPPQEQGLNIENTTGHAVQVDLAGCRIANAGQTIILDVSAMVTPPRPYGKTRLIHTVSILLSPVDNWYTTILDQKLWLSPLQKAMRHFGDDAVMACDTARVTNLSHNPTEQEKIDHADRNQH